MSRQIRTDLVYPPIPCRNFDWAAWDDNLGPETHTAYGRTEEEAIENLLEFLEEYHEGDLHSD